MKKLFRRTPITYYGGKQKLVSTILNLIPHHNLYCEPFCGGAAVFFCKPISNVEILNDTNKELMNFYEVMKTNKIELFEEVEKTLYSRSLFNDAWTIYNSPHLFTKVNRAWALWVLSIQGFSGQLSGTWGYDKLKNSTVKKMNNRILELEEAAKRLRNVQIESTDALRVIDSRDTKDSFFYVDPPYFNSDCGHYDGYTEEDFTQLLETLSKIEGKFLLSSYPSEILEKFTSDKGWFTIKKEMNIDAAKSSRKKIEVLTANYKI